MNTIIDTITIDDPAVEVEPDATSLPIAQELTALSGGEGPDSPDDDPGTASAVPGRPVLMFVDPSTVKVEVNVRKAPKVSREFVASVKRHGVLVPMIGYLDADGDPVIRDGQRRILAAQKAKATEAPAIIYPNRDAMQDADEAERSRIIEQMNANAHREGLSETDELEGIQQLALTGLEATVIAKELSVKPARVQAAITVAGSDFARKVVTKRQITLDQAAVIAEFEGDEDAVRTLIYSAENDSDGFVHEAQRLRDKREREQAFQAEVESYTSQGIPLVEAPPRYDNRTADAYLHEVQYEDGTAVTEENYTGKPGHAICIIPNYGSPRIGHVVTEWRSRGLRRITRGGAVQGKMTEQEKADRREVVANNKEWDSAQVVRRDWLTTLLSRKTLPRDADQFVAYMATERRYDFAKSLESGTATTLLGMEPTPGALAKHVAANPATARKVMFAIAVAAGELALDRSSWRHPSDRDKVFLNWLTAWGYTTSRVEDIIAKPVKPKAKATRSRRAKAEPAVKAQPTVEATEVDTADASEADVDAPAEAEATVSAETEAEAEAEAEVEVSAESDAEAEPEVTVESDADSTADVPESEPDADATEDQPVDQQDEAEQIAA